MQKYQPSEVSVAPPSYADTQMAVSSSTETPQLPRPTNSMWMDTSYGDIKGTWVIDTDLKIPDALLLPSIGAFGSSSPRPNLGLHSAYGVIKGSVFLVSSSSSRAFIKADTEYGVVKLQVGQDLVFHCLSHKYFHNRCLVLALSNPTSWKQLQSMVVWSWVSLEIILVRYGTKPSMER